MGFGVVLVDLSTSEIEFEFVGDLRSLTGLLLVFFVPLIVVWWVVSSSSCPDENSSTCPDPPSPFGVGSCPKFP